MSEFLTRFSLGVAVIEFFRAWSFLRAHKKEVPCMPCSAVQLKPCTFFLRGNFRFRRAFLVVLRAAVIKFL